MTDSFAHSISIIIPTLNEEENIAPLVSEITACAIPFGEILFVDDHSIDETCDKVRALAETHPIRLIEQDGAGPGLATAIMLGARAARGEILLVMDADLSHPPDRIKDLVAPLVAGTADLVVGSRYVKGGSTPGWPAWRRAVSRTGAALAHPLTGIHDSMCGFFAIGRSRLLELAPQTSGFKIVFETMLRARGTLRVREIPIVFRQRVHGKSKMSFGVALRFFFRWLHAKQALTWPAQRRLYIQRLQESSADASRQTRLDVSPSTTTMTSLPGRVPLAIRHLPAESV
jgi:dolichol-phosphate mannosyltransferase